MNNRPSNNRLNPLINDSIFKTTQQDNTLNHTNDASQQLTHIDNSTISENEIKDISEKVIYFSKLSSS